MFCRFRAHVINAFPNMFGAQSRCEIDVIIEALGLKSFCGANDWIDLDVTEKPGDAGGLELQSGNSHVEIYASTFGKIIGSDEEADSEIMFSSESDVEFWVLFDKSDLWKGVWKNVFES